ncbi:hypothetical protein [Haloferula sp. A504]|uniref:hypothetical protein n=1 Tax=Haloferula sp. A504 TaxID=3373601 RepID=UPI0031C4E769|nr:glycoside hydrolase family 32 protein [Verrucomicrobiaceae bacterium E54]
MTAIDMPAGAACSRAILFRPLLLALAVSIACAEDGIPNRGGGGDVNVGHLVRTDTSPETPNYGPQQRIFTVSRKYLVIPIKNGAELCKLQLEIDGKAVRKYETELASDPDDVDWWAFFTIEGYRGEQARVLADRATDEGFALIDQADKVPGSGAWYSEPLRPQLRFSQAVGWNNDPNGMVYHDGEWHLFFQHNPVGWGPRNMTWGHAVSEDLIHWKQLPNAIFPTTMAQQACFSGSGNVDKKNTSGFKTGPEDVLFAFLTDNGVGESIAYSNDRGRSFTWYDGNPLVKHYGRDPKVIWYAYDNRDEPLDAKAGQLGGHWVMAVYDEHPVHKNNIAFYTSTNLKDWTLHSHLPGYSECPELFELPVDLDANKRKWVVFGGDAQYAIGAFDGRTFTPDHEGKHMLHFGPYYASQTFENAPDGRRIQIGWIQMDFPGHPFNQTFSFPHQLTLRTTEDGIRMFAEPVKEIEKLHTRSHTVTNRTLAPGQPVAMNVPGELFHIRAVFDFGTVRTGVVALDIGGNRIRFDLGAGHLDGVRLKPVDGRLTLEVVVDRPVMEIAGNQGRVFITRPRAKTGAVGAIRAFAEAFPGGGEPKLVELTVHELKSIWNKK